jgi:hypothetical protein
MLHPIPKTYVLSKVENTGKNNRGYEPFAETDRLSSSIYGCFLVLRNAEGQHLCLLLVIDRT